MRTDKKSEFLKALKRDRVEEEHEDESHVGLEKVIEGVCNSWLDVSMSLE